VHPRIAAAFRAAGCFGAAGPPRPLPDYHSGRIAFTYLGDIWTADQSGKDVRRLTVHTARDIFPRFSPDGKWIAFSSERSGNLDVYVIPVEGGRAAVDVSFRG